jgi:GPH family glycoside/pentoside/hexuronide:cation symporter
MISIKEKIAYGLGDTASNIIFQTVMMFLLLFYTDVMGLDPAVVGTLFLVVRIIDAVTDPLMGSFADNTKTKWGQFRPYLLWLSLPFAIISILAFTTPNWSVENKTYYAFATYTLLMLAYTAINIPYCALGSALTSNPKDRVSIQSYRFVFGMLGGVIVAGATMPLVEFFGQGNVQKGYQYTMIAMSVLGFVLFLLCFVGTKERVPPPENKQALWENLSNLWKNDQWRVLSTAVFFLLAGQVIKLSLAVYYIKYVVGREDLVTPFMTLGVIGSMIGCAFAQPLAKRVCKIKAYIGLQLTAAAICVLAFFIPHDNITLIFVAFIAWRFFLEMATPILWACMADTVDYGHIKTQQRIPGLVYSSIVFFLKLGVALGGAIAGWLLAYYGYQADQAQTESTKDGIFLSFTVIPAIGSFIVAWVMTKYTLTDQKVEQIQRDLNMENSEISPQVS